MRGGWSESCRASKDLRAWEKSSEAREGGQQVVPVIGKRRGLRRRDMRSILKMGHFVKKER